MASILFYIASALSCILMISALVFNLVNENRPEDNPAFPDVFICIIAVVAFFVGFGSFGLLPYLPQALTGFAMLSSVLGFLCVAFNFYIAGGSSVYCPYKTKVIAFIVLTLAFIISTAFYCNAVYHYSFLAILANTPH